jgi:hypothetical protein
MRKPFTRSLLCAPRTSEGAPQAVSVCNTKPSYNHEEMHTPYASRDQVRGILPASLGDLPLRTMQHQVRRHLRIQSLCLKDQILVQQLGQGIIPGG